jgi:hypothetical protein
MKNKQLEHFRKESQEINFPGTPEQSVKNCNFFPTYPYDLFLDLGTCIHTGKAMEC